MNSTDTVFVVVKHIVEGFHFWENAPEDIEFLRNPHRHLFHVKLYIQVSEDDREIEFFQLKRWLIKVCEDVFPAYPVKKSCEMFAKEILDGAEGKFGGREYKCEVFEDGENGAVVSRTCLSD